MRRLAEYVMKAPRNAAGLAVLLGFLPVFSWLSASIVALVSLRKGAGAGAVVALWAMLPALYLGYLGDSIALPLLLLVFVSAVVLRATVSLVHAVLIQQFCAAVITLLFVQMELPAYQQLLVLFQQIFEKMELAKQFNMPALDAQQLALVTANFYSFSLASTAVLALLVARYWQSILYIPGGFKQEIYQFRLPGGVSTVLVLLLVSARSSEILSSVMLLLTVPLMVAGVALVHGLVNIAGGSRRSLILFYMATFVLGPYLYLPLIIVVLADSFLDFRRRLKNSSQ